MNYQTTVHGVTFDIDYSVDSFGEYDKFDIEVSGQCVNEVLSPTVIKTLEQITWDMGYIPFCKEWNDDLKIDRFLSSQEQ